MRWFDRVVMYLTFVMMLVLLWQVSMMNTNMRMNFAAIDRALIALLTGVDPGDGM
jgi:hypothetical protein